MLKDARIRLAIQEDVPAITDIYNYAVIHTTATQDLHPQGIEARMAWFLAHNPEELPVFVYEDTVSGRVMGWSALSWFSERLGYNRTVENAIYLAPEAFGKGIGSQLLQHLIETARDLGYHSIIARMSAENAASRALHSKYGFEMIGILKEAGFKFERYVDIAFMQLLL